MALIDKASLLMVPSTYEDGTLYNVLPSGNKAPDETGNHNGYDQTRADFTFSRGSNLAATRVNANGLIEKGRENLLTESNNFSDSDWIKYNSNVTSGQEGYDGSSNAWLFEATSAGGQLIQSISLGGVHTASVYAKAGTADGIRLRIDQTSDANAYVNLLDGSVRLQTSTIDIDIQDVSNGWYRITYAFNGSNAVGFYLYPTDGDTTSSAGNIYIQDAQLEYGLVSTPVIRTGATTATAGVLENTPRIDYSSGAGALLLESQRTNLATLSEYFAGWNNQTNVTINSNYTTSPEGLDNASRLLFTANGYIINIGGPSQSSGTQYTLSCYAKRNDSGTQSFGFFKDGSGSVDSAMSLTNEWQRFDYTYTASNNSQLGLAGLNGADVSVYGFQVEASASYASSYIPTHGAAVTRGADSCSVTGVSDVIGQTEGTVYLEFEYKPIFDDANSQTTQRFSVSDGSYTNRITFYPNNSDELNVLATGVAFTGSAYSLTEGETYKVALAYGTTSVVYINGAEAFSYGSGTPSGGYNRIQFADATNTLTRVFGSPTKQVALFNERLSNSELADLTA